MSQFIKNSTRPTFWTVPLNCPAGCAHLVTVPAHATAEEVTKAFREQAEIEATVDEQGNILVVLHSACDNIGLFISAEEHP